MSDTARPPFERFVWIIQQLRNPRTGCPWDRAQTHESLKRYLIEESYEVLDAIEQSPQALCEELGDLLLQVGLHAQIATDNGTFTIDDVLTAISDKLVERHPHVFGSAEAATADEVVTQWEEIKRQKKPAEQGVLASIPRALPALMRAQKISKRAAACGFEWEDLTGIRDKILEELAEFAHEAVQPEVDRQALQDEFGDMLFSLIQLARHQGFDAEEALQRTNRRFMKRFAHMESLSPKKLEELTPAEWRALWDEAKRATRAAQNDGSFSGESE